MRHRERLPAAGPAIPTANHNSHLDAMVLISLLPLRLLKHVRQVAAADNVLRNRIIGWFATEVVGILPIARERASRDEDPLVGCDAALARGDILIFFPEGSLASPSSSPTSSAGSSYWPSVTPLSPSTPTLTHGLGKALPKNEALLVPFFQDLFVGESLYGGDGTEDFTNELRQYIISLSQEKRFAERD